VIDGAQAGKFVIGICNGAQILLEAGLVPGTGPLRRPAAAFAPNAGGRFLSVHVHVRLAVAPERVPVLAGLAAGAVIPAWASHAEGRLAAPESELDALERDGHAAFVYCNARGERVRAHNGSARDIAGLTNRDGNVLAIMPHPERDAWTFNHRDGDRDKAAARGNADAMLAPSGGMMFFHAFAAGLAAAVVSR
jgi:phosphoribosylformylglycinamidine synthase